MYIRNRRELQDTWHKDMSDKEKDIYFCNIKILNMQEYQKHDQALVCIFGLRNSIISANEFHRNSEEYYIKRFWELTHDGYR